MRGVSNEGEREAGVYTLPTRAHRVPSLFPETKDLTVMGAGATAEASCLTIGLATREVDKGMYFFYQKEK